MNANTTRNASVIGVIFRCFLVIFLAWIILVAVMFYALLGLLALEDKSFEHNEDSFAWYYQTGNYDDLCEYLNQYHLVGDEYEQHYEAVEGAILKSKYLQWSAAAEQGMDGAAQKAEEILTQLQVLSEQSKYPENREIFAGFLRELQDL